MTKNVSLASAGRLLAPLALTLTLCSTLPTAALACASCGCSINADWGTQGLSTIDGWNADLPLDRLNQNQLRSGTGTIAPAVAAWVTKGYTGSPAEVELYTRNT